MEADLEKTEPGLRSESDEAFTVVLSNPSAGAILGSNSTVTVTIMDDDDSPANDPPPVVSNGGGGGSTGVIKP